MTGNQKHHIKPFYTKANEEAFKNIVKKLKIENITNKKIDLPRYGDNILAATSSIIIPRAPAKKLVSSNQVL